MISGQVCLRCGAPVEGNATPPFCEPCSSEIRQGPGPATSAAKPLPGWTLGTAIWVWAFFTFAILLLPSVGVILAMGLGYVHLSGPAEKLLYDPRVILVCIISAFVAHLLTLGVGWGVVTRFRRRSFAEAVGWEWHPRFRWLHAAGCVLVFFGIVFSLSHVLPGGETEFDRLLETSATVRIVIATLAVVTAPLVEELVYRGILYPAVEARFGKVKAVLGVSMLFAGVHFQQYGGSLLILVSITLLSLLLTGVRAWTGRLLPSYAIHLLYNTAVAGLILVSHE
ncbi:MAG: CPBP family intramembrane metalloprotease [Acidobacteria bacterium]|nr:CPBP family intramembrane metalloprotease [Acidobacteriota bacterium]